jgi:hypothetical protein
MFVFNMQKVRADSLAVFKQFFCCRLVRICFRQNVCVLNFYRAINVINLLFIFTFCVWDILQCLIHKSAGLLRLWL